MKSLIPWKKEKDAVQVRRESEDPFALLHRQIDELFENFFAEPRSLFGGSPGLGLLGRKGERALASVDVAETDDEVTVTADLPGMTEKDVEVTLDEDLLTIRGTRKEEREDTRKNYHLVERSYGEFHRSIPMPSGIDKDKAKATFKNGVLTLSLPKKPEARTARRRIEIEAA